LFGELVRTHRRRLGWTQEDLAAKAGLSVRSIGKIETNQIASPRPATVRLLADAFALYGEDRARFFGVAASLGLGGTAEPAGRAVPAQLPADVLSFTGRAEHLRTLTALVDGSAGVPLIAVIAGTAGVGKTALVTHWAHRVRDRFPDGQLYIDLRGYDPDQPVRAADALAAFLRALGTPGQEVPLDLDERAAAYRSLLDRRRMLVVLDNASTVEQVRPLLPGSPSCVTVVTSRDRLAALVARYGARRIDLDLLPAPDALDLLRVLVGPRVDSEPEAAADLVDRCARLPLAVRVAAELAAAKPRASLASLVDELADQRRRLDLLDAGGDPRTAVRTVFSWSYHHLPDPARATFRLLGPVPVADLDVYAAAALTGTAVEPAQRDLDLLHRAHLVTSPASGRYGLHDLLRAYAADLAAAARDDTTAALTRLYDHYVAAGSVATNAVSPADRHHRPPVPEPAATLPPVHDEAGALRWLDAERTNLVDACGYAAGRGWPERAVALAAAFFRYLASRSHFADALTVQGHAVDAARRTGDLAAEANAWNGLGMIHWQQGRYAEAGEHLHRSAELFREAGDPHGQIRAEGNLGLIRFREGRYDEASELYLRSIDGFRAHGDVVGEARIQQNLGDVHWRQGRYGEANDRYERALELHQRTGDRVGQASALASIGEIHRLLGDYRDAEPRLRAAIAMFRELGLRDGEGNAGTDLGVVLLHSGRPVEAAAELRHALDVLREIGDRGGEANALNGLGETCQATGEHDAARARHAEALTIAAEIGDRFEEARAHAGTGAAALSSGDPDQARRHWQRALDLFTELEVPEADRVRVSLVSLGPPR